MKQLLQNPSMSVLKIVSAYLSDMALNSDIKKQPIDSSNDWGDLITIATDLSEYVELTSMSGDKFFIENPSFAQGHSDWNCFLETAHKFEDSVSIRDVGKLILDYLIFFETQKGFRLGYPIELVSSNWKFKDYGFDQN